MHDVKQKIIWLWQNSEKILIVIFFLTFTFDVRKVFLTPYSFLKGEFNEYLTLSVSWADVLIIALIFNYTIKIIYSQFLERSVQKNIQYNNNDNKSILSPLNFVYHETFFLFLFIAWAGLSVFWSLYKPVSIFRFISLVEILIFSVIAIKMLSNHKWLKVSLLATILNGILQSAIGTAQFIRNSSLGIHSLGESIIGPNIDGVAKILIYGEKHIRAYGTFPHPNIFAGFIILPLFIVVSEIATRFRNVPRETLLDYIPSRLLYLSFTILSIGFILSFSRSSFLAAFAGFLIYFTFIIKARPWKGILKTVNYISYRNILLFFALLIIIIYWLVTNSSLLSTQSIRERSLYINVSRETIINHPVAGVGLGQFVFNEYIMHPQLESWQYQPVHNLYLLLLSELGFVGLLLFIFAIVNLFRYIWKEISNGRLTKLLYYVIMFSFLVVSVFDHYLWDIKLGTIILVLPSILLVPMMSKSN